MQRLKRVVERWVKVKVAPQLVSRMYEVLSYTPASRWRGQLSCSFVINNLWISNHASATHRNLHEVIEIQDRLSMGDRDQRCF